MKANKGKGKGKTILFILTALIVLCVAKGKGNDPKIIGYTYDSGATVWEMAEKCCPSEMDIRDVVREIQSINGIKNSVVHEYAYYKVPIYETKEGGK